MNPTPVRARLGALAVILVALSLALPAAAMQMKLSRSELCSVSDVVVIAEVTSAETLWAPGDDGAIFRRAWLTTWRAVAGQAADTVEVILPGGEIDGVSHHVEHVPELELDRRYLLFLQRGPDGSLGVVGGEAGAVLVAPPDGGLGEPYISALASVGGCRVR
jgi:hypothetical protein